MEDLLNLGGRVVLITGAGQGVGAEIARYFAAHNAGTLVINDFYADRAESMVEEIMSMGGAAVAMQCDVSSYDDVTKAIAAVEGAVGSIEILVNNAGNAGPSAPIGDRPAFWDSTPADWQPWLDTSLYGVFNCTRSVIGSMVSRRYGRVISVISDAGRVGDGSMPIYAAAKAGVAGFTRSLALASGRYGVTANCVSLAAMHTAATAYLTDDPEMLAKLLRPYSIRRLGEPSDAAAAVLFLASDAAAWITGQTYPVNGGFSFSM